MCERLQINFLLFAVELSANASIAARDARSNGNAHEERINKPLSITDRHFSPSREASVESPSVINPEPHPSGYSFSFLMSNLAPYYIIHWHASEHFFGMCLCLCGDDTESACREKKVSVVPWGMARGISTELARGCKAIAKDSIGFKVSLCSWILLYPILTVGPVWFSGLYRLKCLSLGRMPRLILFPPPS